MRLTFLGTGTSFGIPVPGCDCVVCKSDDPRNSRTRHGLILEEAGLDRIGHSVENLPAPGGIDAEHRRWRSNGDRRGTIVDREKT